MKIKSKKEIEENKQKKKKVLNILKLVLDGLVYTWALIMTICLIAGSCSMKKSNGSTRQQKTNHNALVSTDVLYQDYYVYDFQFTSQDYDRSELEFLFMPNINQNSYNIVPSEADDYNQTYHVPVNDFYVLPKTNTNSNQLILVDEIVFVTKPVTYQSSSSSTGWKGIDRLYGIYIYCYPTDYNDNIWSYLLFNKVNQQAVSDTYQLDTSQYNFYFVTPYISKNVLENTDDILIDKVFKRSDMLNFHLNAILNVNIGVGQGDNKIVVSRPSNSGSDSLYKYYIDTGVFISNGVSFNRITLTYRFKTSSSSTFGYYLDGYGELTNSPGLALFPSGYGCFVSMSYETWTYDYSTRIDGIEVLNRNSVYRNYEGSMTEIYYDEFNWTNDYYKSISFAEINSNAYSDVVWLNQGYDSGYSNGSIVDVFSLLSTAFNSLIGLMSLSVIPGFTIGVLLFMPMVVGLIIVVFRMVKK